MVVASSCRSLAAPVTRPAANCWFEIHCRLDSALASSWLQVAAIL